MQPMLICILPLTHLADHRFGYCWPNSGFQTRYCIYLHISFSTYIRRFHKIESICGPKSLTSEVLGGFWGFVLDATSEYNLRRRRCRHHCRRRVQNLQHRRRFMADYLCCGIWDAHAVSTEIMHFDGWQKFLYIMAFLGKILCKLCNLYASIHVYGSKFNHSSVQQLCQLCSCVPIWQCLVHN